MAMPQGMTSLLGPLARRLNLAVWLNATLPIAALALALPAAAVLFLKMMSPSLAPYVAFAALLVPLAPICGHIRCRRAKAYFTTYQIAEALDHLCADDGAVTTSFERPELIPPSQLHALLSERVQSAVPRIDLAFYVRKIAPPLLFVLLALVIPARKPAASPGSQDILAAVTKPLYEKLELNNEMIPQVDKAALEKELKEITKDKQGISKEKWEAVEELEKRIDNKARETHSNLDNLISQLSELSQDANKPGDVQADSGTQSKNNQVANKIGMTLQNGKLPLSSQQKADLSKLLDQMKKGQGGNLKKQLADLQKDLSKLCQKSGGT